MGGAGQILLYLLGTVATTVLTTIIGQVTSRYVTLGSGSKSGNQQRAAAAPPSAPGVPYAPSVAAPPPPVRRPAVNIGSVIVQAGILQLILNGLGFIFGFLIVAVAVGSGATDRTADGIAEVLWLIIGTIIMCVAFYVIGVRVDRGVHWRHLTYLALGTIILTIVVNSVFLQTAPNVLTFIGATLQTFLAMGIGGGLSMLSGSRSQPQVPVGQMPQPVPVPPPYGGYGYGAAAPPSVPGYYPPPAPAPGPGSLPLYPQPYAGWNPPPAAPPPSAYPYPSAWPYPPAQSGGPATPMPPSPTSQQPPTAQPPREGDH